MENILKDLNDFGAGEKENFQEVVVNSFVEAEFEGFQEEQTSCVSETQVDRHLEVHTSFRVADKINIFLKLNQTVRYKNCFLEHTEECFTDLNKVIILQKVSFDSSLGKGFIMSISVLIHIVIAAALDQAAVAIHFDYLVKLVLITSSSQVLVIEKMRRKTKSSFLP